MLTNAFGAQKAEKEKMKKVFGACTPLLAVWLVLVAVYGPSEVRGEALNPKHQQWQGLSCQGPAMFNHPFGGETGRCVDQRDGTSWLSQCSDENGLLLHVYSTSTTCQGEYETRWNKVGQCFNVYPHASEAFVCHNTSFSEIRAPVVGKPQNPADGVLSHGSRCTSASHCPSHTPYITFWSNSNCQGSPISSSTIFDNMKIGGCFYHPSLMNVKPTCDNGILRISSFQSGCSDPSKVFFYEEAAVNVCFKHPTSGSHKLSCGNP